MLKQNLKPGDFVTTKVNFNKVTPYIYIPLMRDRTLEYVENNKLLHDDEDFAFRVVENYKLTEIVLVDIFTKPNVIKNLYRYKWNNKIFNVYAAGKFWLSYNDFDLPVEPLCENCYNICKQQCRNLLKTSSV